MDTKHYGEGSMADSYAVTFSLLSANLDSDQDRTQRRRPSRLYYAKIIAWNMGMHFMFHRAVAIKYRVSWDKDECLDTEGGPEHLVRCPVGDVLNEVAYLHHRILLIKHESQEKAGCCRHPKVALRWIWTAVSSEIESSARSTCGTGSGSISI